MIKIAIQMDPIDKVDPQTDSTFALAYEALKRNYHVCTYSPASLSLNITKTRSLTAKVKKINKLYLDKEPQAIFGKEEVCELSQFDIILIRQDPPFDINYITACNLLETLPDKVLILNNPRSIRDSPEKLWVTNFSHLMPKTLITNSLEEITQFRNKHDKIVLKPLHGNGGIGVFLIEKNDVNFASLWEYLSKEQNFTIAQEFISNVKFGDKRIILLDGEAVGYINRIPQKSSIRSNLHIGGQAVATQLTDQEKTICQEIGPLLKNLGLFFVGIDVIDNKLTEVNVTSPTGIVSIKQLMGVDIAKLFWDKTLQKIKT